jgi:zinc/manganese transport system substrate-binding protein
MRRLFYVFLALLAFPSLTFAAEKVRVVVSFSILDDLVRQVGGERVEVTSLVGPNGDTHTYQPRPSDSQKLLRAQLVVINGLGFESWADRLIKASGYKGVTLVASKGIKALKADEHEGHNHGGHDHGALDPHAWQNVAHVKLYIANIRDALISIDAGSAAFYQDNAKRYTAELDVLDADIKGAFAQVPKEKRKVITSHDAFTYYGDAYEIQFLSPQGISTDAEASAKDVARMIRQIKSERVKAVFIENMNDRRLMDRIAKETSAQIGGTLYADALSPMDGPAGHYIAMMRHNTKALAASMQ